MFYLKYTRKDNYTKMDMTSETEITQKQLDAAIHALKTQKVSWRYEVPQVILEEIRPEWLVKYEFTKKEKW